jgi:hypothetical protein
MGRHRTSVNSTPPRRWCTAPFPTLENGGQRSVESLRLECDARSPQVTGGAIAGTATIRAGSVAGTATIRAGSVAGTATIRAGSVAGTARAPVPRWLSDELL